MKKFMLSMFVFGVAFCFATHGAEYNRNDFNNAFIAIASDQCNADQIASAEALIEKTVCTKDHQRNDVCKLFANVTYRKNPTITIKQLMETVKAKADSMKYEKPYNILSLSYFWRDDRNDEWYAEMKKYDNYKTTFGSAGGLCMRLKKYDEAYDCFDSINAIWPAINAAKMLNSPEKVFTQAKKLLQVKIDNSDQFGRSIDTLIDMCVGNSDIDQNEVKTLFQNINRKYSVKLIKD